jgi:hypothetical protein
MEEDNIQKLEENNNKIANRGKWSSEKMMGVTAIFISLLSLFAIIYQSYLGREDNKLTRIQQSAAVLPYLSTWFHQSNGEFKFVIGNKGVGPAFIKEVNFKLFDPEKKDTVHFTNTDNLFGLMERRSPLLGSLPGTTSTFRANSLLSKNETKELVVVFYEDRAQGQEVRREFNKFSVGHNIIYEDVYGSKWYLNSENDYPIKVKN